MKCQLLTAAVAIGLFSSVASAQTVTAGDATGLPGNLATPDPVPVTFTRNAATPVADYALRIQYDTSQLDIVATGANGGSCNANDGAGLVALLPPPGQSDLASGTYCNLNVTVAAGATNPGMVTLDVIDSFAGGGCFDSMANAVACTLADGTITVGGPMDTPPTIAYNPTTGSTVTLTGGAGTIVATPSGGMGTGAAATTTVNGCAIGSVAGPGTFGSVAGINLSFVGDTTTPQNINLSCTQGGAVTTGTLTCNETAGGGAPVVRSWPLSCPAGAAGTPPTLNYVPAPGSNVTFVGTPGTTIMSTIAVTGTGGTGSGGSATARVSDCQVSPALSPPVFACQPSGGNVLDFTPGGADPGDIECSCEAPSTGQLTANLTCEETRPLGTTPVVRQWSLTCPGTPGSCGTLVFSPNPGLIQFTGGTASIGISHSGGTMGNDTTFNGCGITGANASSFQISNAPINFSFTGGTTGAGQIDLACTNSTTSPVQATLSCSQVCDVNNTPRTWTLECPAGGTPPPTAEVVPVPSSSDFSRILLAAMLVLIGMAAVTIRGRS